MIGDVLGSFLEVDKSYFVIGKRTMAHILISMDLREGIMVDICLEARMKLLKFLNITRMKLKINLTKR